MFAVPFIRTRVTTRKEVPFAAGMFISVFSGSDLHSKSGSGGTPGGQFSFSFLPIAANAFLTTPVQLGASYFAASFRLPLLGWSEVRQPRVTKMTKMTTIKTKTTMTILFIFTNQFRQTVMSFNSSDSTSAKITRRVLCRK